MNATELPENSPLLSYDGVTIRFIKLKGNYGGPDGAELLENELYHLLPEDAGIILVDVTGVIGYGPSMAKKLLELRRSSNDKGAKLIIIGEILKDSARNFDADTIFVSTVAQANLCVADIIQTRFQVLRYP
jgi:hypothetical protein